jgi:hypothetical protein
MQDLDIEREAIERAAIADLEATVARWTPELPRDSRLLRTFLHLEDSSVGLLELDPESLRRALRRRKSGGVIDSGSLPRPRLRLIEEGGD